MENAMTKKKEESAKKDSVDTGPSKFPDFSEILCMGKTLCKSIQTGFQTIISDYKKKRK